MLLSRTPLEGAQAVGLNAGRSFVHATTAIDGTDFSFYCVHLGWNLEGDLQCREFVDAHLALDPNPYLVLVGDFNDEHLSSQNTILEEVVADAFTAMGWYPGQRISWPSTEFDDTEGSQLIDLVYFRKDFPAIVVEAQVVNLAPVLSDHKPISAELLFPGPGRRGLGHGGVRGRSVGGMDLSGGARQSTQGYRRGPFANRGRAARREGRALR